MRAKVPAEEPRNCSGSTLVIALRGIARDQVQPRARTASEPRGTLARIARVVGGQTEEPGSGNGRSFEGSEIAVRRPMVMKTVPIPARAIGCGLVTMELRMVVTIDVNPG
jgi:hypothetical protein